MNVQVGPAECEPVGGGAYDGTVSDEDARRRRISGMRAIAAIPVAAVALSLALVGCGGAAPEQTTVGQPSSGAVLPGGGLTVAEAIATSAEPPLAVTGWVVGTDGKARLCSTYDAAADEPCGAPSLALRGDVAAKSGEKVTVFGAVEGEAFAVSSTVQG